MDKITLNMSRIIFVVLMCLASIGTISGQEYKYEPMVREGVKWYFQYSKTARFEDTEDSCAYPYNYEVHFKGDTVMNGGRTYKKLYMTFVEPHDFVENCEWPLAWLRETDKRVYAILNPNNPFVQTDQMMTLSGPRTPTEDYDSTGEWLLFDFNNIHVNYNSTLKNSMTMERSDSDFVFDGYKRVTYKPKYGNNKFYIVEGYGALNGKHFIFPVHNYFGYPNPYGDYSVGMTHVTNDNGDILYKTSRYDLYLTVSDVSATPKAKIKVTQGLITAESADDGTLYLYTISGTLASKQSGNGNATCSIGTDGLAPGIYVAVWRGTSSVVSQKVVVH